MSSRYTQIRSEEGAIFHVIEMKEREMRDERRGPMCMSSSTTDAEIYHIVDSNIVVDRSNPHHFDVLGAMFERFIC